MSLNSQKWILTFKKSATLNFYGKEILFEILYTEICRRLDTEIFFTLIKLEKIFEKSLQLLTFTEKLEKLIFVCKSLNYYSNTKYDFYFYFFNNTS